MLKILPEVAKEKKLALHGGTAINLFHLNMPRLSVDTVKIEVNQINRGIIGKPEIILKLPEIILKGL